MMKQALLLTLCIASVLLNALPLCAQEQPIFDVPRVEKIVIDGRDADWADKGYRVELVPSMEGTFLPADDLDVAFRLGWDARGLLVLLNVTDDVPVEYDEPEEYYWYNDCVEVFLADKRGGMDMIYAFVTPGCDPDHPEPRFFRKDRRTTEELKKQPPTVEAARTKTATGYVMEILVPWSNVGVEPELGREVGVQLYVNEADGPEWETAARWFPNNYTAADTNLMHRVRLSETPSRPVTALATGAYENFRRTSLAVTAVKKLIGKPVAIRMGDVELSKGTLSDKGGRAAYTIELPMPTQGTSYGPLDVFIGDELIGTITLPDVAEQRARAFTEAPLYFEPAVFLSERFPACAFEQPSRVEDLIGRYTIDTTFYDKDYNEVEVAEQPGRYGAVVQITTESGRRFRRFRTLYRLPGPLDDFKVWRTKVRATISLPEAYGVDARVIESQSHIIGDFLKWDIFAGDLSRDSGFAALLAGLAETEPAAPPAGITDDVFARDRQWWIGLKRKLYGMDTRYPDPFVCPRPIEGKPARVLHDGTAAEAGMKPDAVEKIDAVCQEWLAESGEAFAVCLVRHGVVFFHKAYGTRDGEPMTVTTPSSMASITKLMSGTLLMMLVDQGLIELDGTIDEYLPPFKGIEVETPLTIRFLYNHTHGLPNIWGEDMNDLEEVLAGYYPDQDVCKRWEYSGTGLTLGSKIIELMSGEVLPRFYRNHLLDPLGCTNTEVMGNAGDAFSTPLDMATIGQMLLNGGAYGDKRFFSEETFEQMLPRPYPDMPGLMAGLEYGVGTSRYDKTVALGFGEDCFGHGAGSNASFLIDPTHDLILVVTRNRGGEHFDKYKGLFIRAVLDSLEKSP
jgi:CubicO group peptidase (beta-lactamase class C family)